MKSIGNVTLGEVPRVVLAVSEFETADWQEKPLGVSILEIRADFFKALDRDILAAQIKSYQTLGYPLILTIRQHGEGGAWQGSESERKRLFLQSLPEVDCIDVELEAREIREELLGATREAGKCSMLSNHSFEGTPSDQELARRVEEARHLGADIVKIACTPNEAADVQRILACVERFREGGIIGIAMGSLGVASRVEAFRFGSLLTYTSRVTKYGQMPLSELVERLRMRYPTFDAEFKN